MLARSDRRPVQVRAGFTLIEMLVVISLIALIAAIAAGTLLRIRGGQDKDVTTATMSKIHSNLDTKWKVILADARKTVPQSLITYCGNDKDRALVVWTYAKLKNELPETPEEAVAGVVVPGTPTSTTLAPRRAFATVASSLVASRLLPEPEAGTDPVIEAPARQAARESGALLLVALAESGGGGNVMNQDGVGGQIATPGPATKNLSYYKDGWDRPIAFVRHAFADEIDRGHPAPGTDYTKPTPGVSGALQPPRTSLDPGGKLHRINPWSVANGGVGGARTQIVIALNANRPVAAGRGPQPEDGAAGSVALTLDNKNSVPTLVSAGPNKDFGDYFGNDTVGDDGADNILSFRSRREGARGD